MISEIILLTTIWFYFERTQHPCIIGWCASVQLICRQTIMHIKYLLLYHSDDIIPRRSCQSIAQLKQQFSCHFRQFWGFIMRHAFMEMWLAPLRGTMENYSNVLGIKMVPFLISPHLRKNKNKLAFIQTHNKNEGKLYFTSVEMHTSATQRIQQRQYNKTVPFPGRSSWGSVRQKEAWESSPRFFRLHGRFLKKATGDRFWKQRRANYKGTHTECWGPLPNTEREKGKKLCQLWEIIPIQFGDFNIKLKVQMSPKSCQWLYFF